MDGAEVLEKLEEEQGKEAEEPGKFEKWLNDKFGEKKAFSFMMYISVAIAIVMSVGLFILLPTAVMNLIKKAGLSSIFLLNLCEGLLRICMFIVYVLAISSCRNSKICYFYYSISSN